MQTRRRRRRNPEVAVRKVVTVHRKAVSSGWFSSTEGKVMLVGGLAVAAVVAYFVFFGGE